MENFKAVLIYVVAISAVMVLGFGLTYVDWASYNFFAPKYENTRRQVFEQSNAYNAGMIRDLENLQMEYQRADSNQKDALRPICCIAFLFILKIVCRLICVLFTINCNLTKEY